MFCEEQAGAVCPGCRLSVQVVVGHRERQVGTGVCQARQLHRVKAEVLTEVRSNLNLWMLHRSRGVGSYPQLGGGGGKSAHNLNIEGGGAKHTLATPTCSWGAWPPAPLFLRHCTGLTDTPRPLIIKPSSSIKYFFCI